MAFLYNLKAGASALLPGMVWGKNESTENSPSVPLIPSSTFLPALPSCSPEEAATELKQTVQNVDFHRICRMNVEMGVTNKETEKY